MQKVMRLGHQVMAPWGRKIRGRYHRSLALRPCLGWPQNIEAIIKLHCALCITPTVSVAAILAVPASLDGLHWLRGFFFFFAPSTKLYLMTMSTDMQMMFFPQAWTGKQLFQDVVNGKVIHFWGLIILCIGWVPLSMATILAAGSDGSHRWRQFAEKLNTFHIRDDRRLKFGCFFEKNPNGLWPPPPSPLLLKISLRFFATIPKYA